MPVLSSISSWPLGLPWGRLWLWPRREWLRLWRREWLQLWRWEWLRLRWRGERPRSRPRGWGRRLWLRGALPRIPSVLFQPVEEPCAKTHVSPRLLLPSAKPWHESLLRRSVFGVFLASAFFFATAAAFFFSTLDRRGGDRDQDRV